MTNKGGKGGENGRYGRDRKRNGGYGRGGVRQYIVNASDDHEDWHEQYTDGSSSNGANDDEAGRDDQLDQFQASDASGSINVSFA